MFFRALILCCLFTCMGAVKILAQHSEKGTTTINKAADAGMGTTWAIVIGISDYQNIVKLNYADRDAIAFYNYLRSPEVGVQEINIRKLINKEATSTNIFEALKWLSLSVKENDRVIFYFSGHGDVENVTVDENGFLLAVDAPKASYWNNGTVGIQYLQSFIKTYAIRNKAKQILLIVDACRSGKLAGGKEGAEAISRSLEKSLGDKITKILSAQPGELSFEDQKWGGGRGVFSYYLLKGIQGLANLNTDEMITTFELTRYLDAVTLQTNSAQNPKIEGNVTEVLFKFNDALLAEAKKNEDVPLVLMASNSKGIGADLGPLINQQFAKYNEMVKKGWLLWGASEKDTLNSALKYYQQLLKDPAAEKLYPTLKSSFLAALQRRSQSKLDDYLKGQSYVDPKKDIRTVKEIEFAATLVEKNDILYRYVNARALFFKSVLINDNWEAIKVLKQALQLDADAPYVLNRLALRFSEAKQTDSAIFYYQRAMALAPTWSYPYNNIALQYKAQKNYDKAIVFLNKALSIDPKFALAMGNLGEVYQDMKKNELALVHFKKALALDPNDPVIYSAMGDFYFTLKNYKTAIEYYHKALVLDSTNAQYFVNLGSSNLMLKAYETAKQQLNKAIAQDPNYASAYVWLGMLYHGLKDFDQAVSYALKGIALDSTQSYAYNSLGSIYYNSKNIDKALMSYKKAITLDSNSYEPYSNLGILYANTKDYELATTYYQKSIAIDSTYAYPYFGLGIIAYTANDKAKAEVYFKKGIGLDSTVAFPYNALGLISVTHQKYDQAIAYFKKAIALEPDFVKPHYNLAEVYVVQQKLEKAIEFYKAAMVLDPKNPDIPNKIADSYYNSSNFKQAVQYYKQAIKGDPSKIIPYLNLGNSYKELQLLDSAKIAFQQAELINPNDISVNVNLGNVYDAMGNLDEALKYKLKAVAIDSTYANVLTNAGYLYKKMKKTDLAISYYKRAILINPKDTYALKDLIKLYLEKEDIEQTKYYAKAFLKTDKSDGSIFAVLGLLEADAAKKYGYLFKAQELSNNTAAKAIAEALGTKPDDVKRGMVFYADSLGGNMTSSFATYAKAEIYFYEKDYQHALAFFEQAFKLDSKLTYGYENAAIAAIYTKNYDKGIQLLNMLIRLEPKNAYAFYNLACIYSLTNQIPLSLENLKKSFELGYKDEDHFMKDTDLLNVRKSDKFQGLINEFFPKK